MYVNNNLKSCHVPRWVAAGGGWATALQWQSTPPARESVLGYAVVPENAMAEEWVIQTHYVSALPDHIHLRSRRSLSMVQLRILLITLPCTWVKRKRRP